MDARRRESRMEIALDTSALVNLNSGAIPTIAAKAARLDTRIVLPFATVHEFLDGDDEAKAVERVAFLKDLRRAVGPRLVMSDDVGVIIDSELQGSIVERTPCLQGDEARAADVLLGPDAIDMAGFRIFRASIPSYLA